MALKLRRQTGGFTNGMLAQRASGRPPDPSRTGADSFKRVLDSTRTVTDRIKSHLSYDDSREDYGDPRADRENRSKPTRLRGFNDLWQNSRAEAYQCGRGTGNDD